MSLLGEKRREKRGEKKMLWKRIGVCDEEEYIYKIVLKILDHISGPSRPSGGVPKNEGSRSYQDLRESIIYLVF